MLNKEVKKERMENKVEGRRKFDLEDRLVDFSVLVIEITDSLYNTRAGNYYAGQLLRSGNSPALNYGEAQSGESRNDFIHKLRIVLKELRESRVAMKVIKKVPLTKKIELLGKGMNECNELIAIFVKSIETAGKNNIGRN
jgi:four helix bundle protein